MSRRRLAVISIILGWCLILACSGPSRAKKNQIVGQVLDAFGHPLPATQVSVAFTTFKAETDNKGQYAVGYVPGEFQVHITKEGYTSVTLPLKVATETTFPAAPVTLYKIPSEQGVWFVGEKDYSLLPKGTIGVKTEQLLQKNINIAVAVYQQAPLFIKEEGKLQFLDNDARNQTLVKLDDDSVIVIKTVSSALVVENQMTEIKENIHKITEGLFFREVVLEEGEYAFVEFVGKGPFLKPVEPIYHFEVIGKKYNRWGLSALDVLSEFRKLFSNRRDLIPVHSLRLEVRILAKLGKIAEANKLAQTIQNASIRDWSLYDITIAQTEAGDISGALEMAQTIQNASARYFALRNIAVAQTEAGDISGALEMAQTIQDADTRAQILGGIAVAQAKAGDISGALEMAQTIQDADTRVRALGGIAKVRAKAGDISGALEMAQTIQDADTRARALGDIAVAQAKAGDTEKAQHTFTMAFERTKGIQDAPSRARALHDISRAQAEVGDISGALEMAQTIQNASMRAWTLGDIAVAQAEVGDISGALKAVAGFKDDPTRSFGLVLQYIAVAQVKAGDISGALKVVAGFESAQSRVDALSAIAITQAKAGDKRGAAWTFRESLKTARSQRIQFRAPLLLRVTKSLLDAGFIKQVETPTQP